MPTHCVRERALKLLQALGSVSFAVRSSFKQACLSPPTVSDPRAAALQLMLTSSSGGTPAHAAPCVATTIAAPMTLTVKARMTCPFPLAFQRQRRLAVPFVLKDQRGRAGGSPVRGDRASKPSRPTAPDRADRSAR